MNTKEDGMTRYLIPDNFIEEGTVFQGRIKILNLAEAAVLAGIFLLPGMAVIKLLGITSLQARVCILAALCVPPAAAGIAGFNGDRIFLAVKCMILWLKNRETMLYNPRPVIIRNDPVRAIDTDVSAPRRFLSVLEEKRRERMDRRAGEVLREGEDFFFTPEDGMERFVRSASGPGVAPVCGDGEQYADGEILEGEVDLY